MKVKDVMISDIKYAPSGTSLKQAAQLMAGLDCGFLPVGNPDQDKLLGVVTDRDIVIRAVADGDDPNTTSVDDVMTDRVLYCFADDDLDTAANSMRDQHVYRLIVLNSPDEKRLCGIISLGDMVRGDELASRAVKGIAEIAA